MSRHGYVKSLELKGICRALSQSNGVDGVTDDMMNLRMENGSWKAMKTLQQVFPTDGSTTPYTRIWVHIGSDYKHVLGVMGGELHWFASIVGERWQAVTPPKVLCPVDDNDLCHENGNLVTVGGDKFLLWKQGDGSYILYDYDQNGEPSDETLVPDGNIDFRVVQDRTEDGGINAIYQQRVTSFSSLASNLYQKINITEADVLETLQAFCASFELGHRKKNSFYAPFLVCTALKTYSGDYVLASRPKLMNPQSILRYCSQVDAVDGNTLVQFYNSDNDEYNVENHATSPYAVSSNMRITNVERLDEGITNDTSDILASCTAYLKNGVLRINGSTSSGNKLVTMPDVNFPTFSCTYTGGQDVTNLFALGSKTKLQIKGMPLSDSDKTIYTKLCVFITPMCRDYKYTKFYNYKVSSTGNANNTPIGIHREKKAAEDVVKDLMSQNFYKLAEMDVTTLKNDWVDVKIDDGVLFNIVHQDTLSADTTTRDGIKARGSYSYNGRLHLYDYDRTQFHGYPLSYFFERSVDGCVPVKKGYDNQVVGMSLFQAQTIVGGETRWSNEWQEAERGWSWYVGVEIEREDGLCQVVRYAPFQTDVFKLDGETIYKNNVFARQFFSLNGCLSYPDTRAKKMIVYIRSFVKNAVGDVVRFYRHEFPLTPHERLNMACYIDPELKPIDITPTLAMMDGDKKTFSEINMVKREANGMRVSAVDNPLYLPAEYSYKIGNTGIVGMMANEIAVGEGQTGDAPLMVFCRDGIYGLFVDDTGQLAYRYARPIASDVCNNAASIVRVDGGIVFGTERGLCMLKGANAVDIGEICEGDPLDFMNDKRKRDADFPNVARGAFCHQNIGGFGTISPSGTHVTTLNTKEDFREYQSGASVGYDHKEKELVVANDVRGYCYVKDYDGRWRRMSQRVSEVIACYPETYVLSEGHIYTLDRMKSSGAMRRVWLMTRPINLQTIGYRVSDSAALKENYRVVVRGEFGGADNHIVGLYVLGSLDGRRWSVIGGNERHGAFVDLGCLVERVDVNYLCIVVSGDIGESGKIDEVLVETRYKH